MCCVPSVSIPHRLLAVALQPGSRVLQLARERVTCFMRDPAARTKARTPDIGVLLVDYLLVPREEAPWAQFGPVFVREVLARQVRAAVQRGRNGRTGGLDLE